MPLVFTRLTHFSLQAFAQKSHRDFFADRGNLRARQLQILQRILQASAGCEWGRQHGVDSTMNYRAFRQRVPLMNWAAWAPFLERERAGDEGIVFRGQARWQPTSGSGHARKWIPYTPNFLDELNRAVAVWMADLYHRFPAIARGVHYWSLSWLPENLRGQTDNSDLALFSRVKRLALRQIMAVADSVQQSGSSEAARFATLAMMAARNDLTMISVWSPTFLLAQWRDLERWREELAKTLHDGNWGRWARDLQGIRCPRHRGQAKILAQETSAQRQVKDLWPQLALISAWESAQSQTWAQQIRNFLPGVPLQGKGLFATEGVVTIPLHQGQALTYTSHFYEFLRGDEIVPSWELHEGDEVSPILSTGSGILRYHLPDRLAVRGHFADIPLLDFMGRDASVDLVGEKMHHQDAAALLATLATHTAARPLVLLALEESLSGMPGYAVVFAGALQPHEAQMLASRGESKLAEVHHYRLARELGQLAPLRVENVAESTAFYQRLCHQRGQIEGDLKPDPFVRVSSFDGLEENGVANP
jgi:hypothetical protein